MSCHVKLDEFLHFFKTKFYWRQEKVTLYNDLMSNDTSILERRSGNIDNKLLKLQNVYLQSYGQGKLIGFQISRFNPLVFNYHTHHKQD